MAEQLVTLWRYRDLPEALIAKSKLESDAVWCSLADTEVVRLDWFRSNFFGGVRLQVADEDAEHAWALLSEEIPVGFTAEETGEAYEQPGCPKCQSRDVGYEHFHRGFALAFLWLISLPVWIPKRLWHCEDCGYEWKANYE
jgi:DNA-directed RNA polymerase subunit M/transcription elongation factor TFIIS